MFAILHFVRGDVSEGFKEAVLKTVDVKTSVGSNPTISAKSLNTEKYPSGYKGLPC